MKGYAELERKCVTQATASGRLEIQAYGSIVHIISASLSIKNTHVIDCKKLLLGYCIVWSQ